MDVIKTRAAIVGLLHEIGKIGQRASDRPTVPPEDTAEEGQPVHAAYSIRMIEELLRNNEELRKMALPGAYHHRPQKNLGNDDTLSWLVAVADKLCAGERTDREQKSQESPPMQLQTIFDSVSISAQRDNPTHFLPVSALSLNKHNIFPTGMKRKSDTKDDYDTLKKTLMNHFMQLSSTKPDIALEQMLSSMTPLQKG